MAGSGFFVSALYNCYEWGKDFVKILDKFNNLFTKQGKNFIIKS